MSDLDPVAFDIETSGFDPESCVTTIGFAHELSISLYLNTNGGDVNTEHLQRELEQHASAQLELQVCPNEKALLDTAASFITTRLDGNTHYLTAYNGETWNGGFDLPYLRSAYLRQDVPWPFTDFAYADMMEIVERFETYNQNDLTSVYDTLIGKDTCDPFSDSAAAVDAYENENWAALLKHNLADVQRTHELAVLAGRFVPASDFSMKNLAPPNHL